MPPPTPPPKATLAELRIAVALDLRDPQYKTFSSDYIDALINAGIEEVGRLYPVEKIDVIPVAPGTYSYATTCENAFRLEVWRDGELLGEVEPSIGDSQSGWDLFAGSVHIPKRYVNEAIGAGTEIHLWGYDQRVQLTNDTMNSDLDATGMWGVRRYARSEAFNAMNNDRALYKQWQGQSQNSDVSPNMLNQMVSLYASEWDRHRNYLRRLRRS